MLQQMHEDAIEASQATVERKKRLLMKVAEYGLQEEVTSDNEEDVQLRQVNPSAAVAAIKELNAMDGHNAITASKLVIEDKRESTATQLAQKHGLSPAEVHKALSYRFTEGLSDVDAVKRVVEERATIDVIEGEIVEDSDDEWPE